jgi:hypothetical protein
MTDEAVALARVLWDEGVVASAIAQRIGVTKDTLLGLVHRRGWPARPSPIGVRKAPLKPPPKPQPDLKVACKPQPLAVPTPAFRTCQWISGSDRRTWTMCGAPAVKGAWCEACYRRVYVRPPRWERLEAA